MKEVILYRGPLERARLKLIINSVLYENPNEVDFIWISPKIIPIKKSENFQNFISEFRLNNVHIYVDKGSGYFTISKCIKKLYKGVNITKTHFVGFSSWLYSNSCDSKKKIWYVNGVPEEGLLYNNSLNERLKNYLQWKINFLFQQPDLIVTVSKPMTSLMKNKVFSGAKYVEIPITSDTILFKNNKPVEAKKYLTYLGSGAPWQSLDILKDLWYNLYLLDNELKFRVISKDERTKVLGERLPLDSIEYVGSSDFNDVAQWLSEAKIGFLIRREDIVNRVAFPTKFAEYTASGSLVALSELSWDLTSYLKEFNVGVLVPTNKEPKEAAQLIIEYLRNTDDKYLSRLSEVSKKLSNEYWIPVLSQCLN